MEFLNAYYEDYEEDRIPMSKLKPIFGLYHTRFQWSFWSNLYVKQALINGLWENLLDKNGMLLETK